MTQSDDLAKAIAFALWPILKIFLFLEYLAFFEGFFFAQNNSKLLIESILACLKVMKTDFIFQKYDDLQMLPKLPFF